MIMLMTAILLVEYIVRRLKKIFGNTCTENCQLKGRPTDRSVTGVVGTRIDRELALVGVGSKRACDQDGESQEWGLACRWHGDVTQLSTPQKVGCSRSELISGSADCK